MCAHMLAWGMLQPGQGGASLEEAGKLSAYYEALPNEAGVNEPVHFDAAGSHVQTADGTTTEGLTYAWDFGDGTTGTGKDPYHRYAAEGTYQSKLTVTNTANGQTASMEIPIVVQAVPAVPLPIPALEAPETDEDGTFDLGYSLANARATSRAGRSSRPPTTGACSPTTWRRRSPRAVERRASRRTRTSRRGRRATRASRSSVTTSTASGARSYWTGIPLDKLKPGLGPAGRVGPHPQGAAPGPAGGGRRALLQLAVPQRGRRLRLRPGGGGERRAVLGDRRHPRRRGRPGHLRPERSRATR